jgi:hypothetical protein
MFEQAPDKFSAVWLSHSSTSDFLQCPRAYFLKNIYKDPKTRHKIQIMTPALALGGLIHEIIENLSQLPTEQRFKESLLVTLKNRWPSISGQKGGFSNPDQEQRFFQRGEAMLSKVMAKPGPLTKLAVKIKADLPNFWLSESEGLILCGKLDWMEYLPETDSVHIIDFKTSKTEEKADSLQLPIYYLLATQCQKRPVTKASYWYLDFADDLSERPLPDAHTATAELLQLGKQIKLARQLERFRCPNGESGCMHCQPFERVLKGEGTMVGTDVHGRRDVYILPYLADAATEDESVIL